LHNAGKSVTLRFEGKEYPMHLLIPKYSYQKITVSIDQNIPFVGFEPLTTLFPTARGLH